MQHVLCDKKNILYGAKNCGINIINVSILLKFCVFGLFCLKKLSRARVLCFSDSDSIHVQYVDRLITS